MTMVSDLFAAAQKAFGKAYAPYSKFCVGAAILGDDGKIYNGCNVENVSYPCGTCAEAGAIAAMLPGEANPSAKSLSWQTAVNSLSLAAPACNALPNLLKTTP